MHKRPVIGGWASVRMRRRRGLELQLFALLGQFQPQKNLQLSLIPLHFVRPVTPNVAGSSPVPPAIWMPAVVQNRITCSSAVTLGAASWWFGHLLPAPAALRERRDRRL